MEEEVVRRKEMEEEVVRRKEMEEEVARRKGKGRLKGDILGI